MSYIGQQLQRIGLYVDYKNNKVINEYPDKVRIKFSHVGKESNQISITNAELSSIYKILRKGEGITANRRRGLRKNGMDDKRNKWQLFGYDVWGNAEDGFEVNNVFPGPVITLTNRAEYNEKQFNDTMRRRGSKLRYSMIDQGASDEDTIYFQADNGEPLAELRRLKR